MTLDEEYMEKALALAEKAFEMGEIPVGALVVDPEGNIIGEGYNLRETTHSPTAHAEVLAIEQAAKTLGQWRLSDCTLYVTLEPCPMCAGAILGARFSSSGGTNRRLRVGGDALRRKVHAHSKSSQQGA